MRDRGSARIHGSTTEYGVDTPEHVGERNTLTLLSPEAKALLPRLCTPRSSRRETQEVVERITTHLVRTVISSRPDSDSILVVPMRAALPMWAAASRVLGAPESTFPHCFKHKGTRRVDVVWPRRPIFEGRRVILLDTVIATGDTIQALLKEIDLSMSTPKPDVTVLTCYAAPESLRSLVEHRLVSAVAVGAVADSVDERGYLIPPTHGDVGDKMFGRQPEVFSQED